MSGSEDTGWVRLNATSADGIQPASADWNLTFAPEPRLTTSPSKSAFLEPMASSLIPR